MADRKSEVKDDMKNDRKTAVKQRKVRFSLRLKFSLAIIFLVSMIVLTTAIYFIWRESDLLKNQIFEFVKREMVHLSNTAQQSIGIDELAIIASVKDLETISYIKYAYVLNRDQKIIQYFDRRGGKQAIGSPINDIIKRELDSRTKDTKIKNIEAADPQDANGTLYDFSKIVINKIDKTKLGSVVIGLSDVIIRNERKALIQLIATISFVFLGIAIVGAIVLASITISPIRKLSHGVDVIGKGDLDYRIDVKTSDEIGQLANEFNQMTAQIKEAKNKEIESRIMEEQLEMARDIQEGLNPMDYYDKNGIEIKGFTRAAKGVGGDYFDYLDIDGDRVCALISDVSGKGVPASLVMVMIRTVFTTYISQKNVDCARVVRAINDSLSADFAIDKFATLFFLIYNRRTEELSFANAGHGPLFLYRSDLKSCTTTKLEGVPIGIMEDVEYKQAKVKLRKGDIVILYTDGITEMRNPDKEEYGIERVHQLLLEKNHLNANDLVDTLVGDVDSFRGEASPHDDMTTLVFKRSG